MRKIVVNGRFLTQKITGINRFAFELCKALDALGVEVVIIAPKKIQPDYIFNGRVEYFGWSTGALWEQVDLPLYLLRNHNPLLLSFSGLGPIFYRNKITTIHDLAFLANPRWYSKNYYWFYRLGTPVMAKYSKKIFTVSNFSKSEIIAKLQIAASKIEVIHNAVIPHTLEVSTDERKVEGKYILTVSSLDPRKNLLRLIEAYHRSGLADEYKFVWVGKRDKVFNMQISPEIAEHSFGYVTDEALQQLYRQASLFVYPSLYEGFGIPPLEAMSCGCPTVISDIPVFREIFGNASCFVDPFNVDEIKDGMIKVLSDNVYRESIIRQGYEQASRYTWEDSARSVIQVIQSVLQSE